ncbi:MAG: hypothetical protein ACLQVD_22180 [Capsulimonadaceae bacterium]
MNEAARIKRAAPLLAAVFGQPAIALAEIDSLPSPQPGQIELFGSVRSVNRAGKAHMSVHQG